MTPRLTPTRKGPQFLVRRAPYGHTLTTRRLRILGSINGGRRKRMPMSSARVPPMTVKLVVLYTQPDDAASFDAHYLGVHGPLVEKIPGLQRWESARFVAAPDGGEQTYH